MTAVLRYRNVAVGVALILLGGVTLVAMAGFPWDRAAAADAALLPRLIAVAFLLVGLALAIQGYLQGRLGGQAPDDDAEGVPIDVDLPEELLADREPEGKDARAALLLSVLAVGYGIAAFTFGFIPSTLLFLVAGSLVLGHQRRGRPLIMLVIFAIVLTAAYYLGFFELLGVRHPITLLP